MNELKSLLVISPAYPIEGDPVYCFVEQFCLAIANKGLDVIVIAPQNILKYLTGKRPKHPYLRSIKMQKGVRITIYQPSALSFSHIKIGSFNPSEWSHMLAVKNTLRKIKCKPSAIYGHFWRSAYEGYNFAKNNEIPLFVASGESIIGNEFVKKNDSESFPKYVRGVICVSSKNRDESIALGLTTKDKCEVFPNAVNEELFHKRDRAECREQLGLPQDAFIVAFVGSFTERKGPLRVMEAINRLEGVKSVFIGNGPQEPCGEGILFKGLLPHNQVPIYLCAADCFVLPTLHEGCCNAVIEAMACGLPIISSNRSFNWDVLDDNNSIMVDPESVEEIAKAIGVIKDDPSIRKEMSISALNKVERLTIENRAEAIIRFIKEKINNR